MHTNGMFEDFFQDGLQLATLYMLPLRGMMARILYQAAGRSPQWYVVRRTHLQYNPFCMGCGGVVDLQVHHIRPFHLFPELELDPSNLITLCECDTRLCHYGIGHCYDWKSYNPFAREDAAQHFHRFTQRLYTRADGEKPEVAQLA